MSNRTVRQKRVKPARQNCVKPDLQAEMCQTKRSSRNVPNETMRQKSVEKGGEAETYQTGL